MIKKIAAPLLLILFIFSSIVPVNARTLDAQPIQSITKEWTVSFSQSVNAKTDFSALIYIEDDNKKKIDVSYSLSEDLTKVIVFPKNPYHFGTNYKLVVSDELVSSSGARLKESWTRPFSVKSTYIEQIEANFGSLFTNVKVISPDKQISRMTVSLDGVSAELEFHRDKDGQFSRGIPGLYKGALLKISVYGESNLVIDTQYYTVK